MIVIAQGDRENPKVLPAGRLGDFSDVDVMDELCLWLCYRTKLQV